MKDKKEKIEGFLRLRALYGFFVVPVCFLLFLCGFLFPFHKNFLVFFSLVAFLISIDFFLSLIQKTISILTIYVPVNDMSRIYTMYDTSKHLAGSYSSGNSYRKTESNKSVSYKNFILRMSKEYSKVRTSPQSSVMRMTNKIGEVLFVLLYLAGILILMNLAVAIVRYVIF